MIKLNTVEYKVYVHRKYMMYWAYSNYYESANLVCFGLMLMPCYVINHLVTYCKDNSYDIQIRVAPHSLNRHRIEIDH